MNSYRPLSKKRLAKIEQDFDRILSMNIDGFLRGGLKEYRVHFIIRSFEGFLNYDIDNLLYRPENNWKSIALSIKHELHDIDFPYKKLGVDFLAQLIYNENYTKFKLANVNGVVMWKGNRKELENRIRDILCNEEWQHQAIEKLW